MTVLQAMLNAFWRAWLRFRTEGARSTAVYLRSRLTNRYLRWRNNMGSSRVECPICGWQGHDFLMLDCGRFVVPHVTCPQCLGQERHRLLHLYLTRHDPGFASRRGLTLHFAPEPHVRAIIDGNPGLLCLSTDYARCVIAGNSGTSFQSDIQRLPVKDETFTAIFCLHMLEHIPDDRTAVLEMHKILKKGGVAYIMVPFMMGWEKTVEFGAPDPAIFEHVRGYSPNDFAERLAPFTYEAITAPSLMSAAEIRRHRIPPGSQIIYRCIKS